MAIHRLNHAVLYVRDVDVSVDFYHSALGFEPVQTMTDAAFLRAPDSTNDHDLALFAIGSGAGDSGAGRSTVGLYHLAWEVDTLGDLAAIEATLRERGALVGASDHGTTKSLYAKDPDGLEFEIVWLIPADLLADGDKMGTQPLDLSAELARFGADTQGGIGISRPAMI